MQWPVNKHLDWNIKIKRQGNKTVHVTLQEHEFDKVDW